MGLSVDLTLIVLLNKLEPHIESLISHTLGKWPATMVHELSALFPLAP